VTGATPAKVEKIDRDHQGRTGWLFCRQRSGSLFTGKDQMAFVPDKEKLVAGWLRANFNLLRK
jgi:hypothetical protein